MIKKISASLLLLAVVIAAPAISEAFMMSDLHIGARGTKAVEKSSGRSLWQNTIVTKKVDVQGKPFLYIEDKGEGIWGKDGTYKTWAVRSFFRIEGDKLVPHQVKGEFKDKSGKVLRSFQKDYLPKEGKVLFTENGKTKEIKYTEGMIDKENLGISMSNFPFEKKEFIFSLLTHEPTSYKMTGKNLGKEKITVKGTEMLCNKIEMVPDLGLVNMLGAFVPKTYFWLESAAPHQFIRYEGLESGLGTPYIIIEDR